MYIQHLLSFQLPRSDQATTKRFLNEYFVIYYFKNERPKGISGVLLEKIIPLHTLCFQLFVIFVSKIK